MKKIILKTLIATLLISGLYVTNLKAQPINIGGGLVIGTSRPNLGLKVNGTYGMDFLLENLRGSAAFTIFIPATRGSINYNRWAIDVDGQYSFFEVSDFEFYAIGGLNIAYYKSSWDVSGTTISSGVKPGLNVGAGAFYNFKDNMKAFSEFKYILSNYDQAEITFGVLFTL